MCIRDRYGSQFDIANAFLDKIETWPNIKPEDGHALEKFSVFLASCENYTEDIGALNQLHSPKELQMILQKLPYKQREKWRTHALKLIEVGQSVSFSELVRFITRESKLLNMPVFGTLKGPRGKADQPKNDNTYPQRWSTTAMATGVAKENKQKTMPPCPCCSRNDHSLNDCSDFKQRAYENRRGLVLSKGLCFGCLKGGHRSKDCSNRLTCSICRKKHPTSLHLDDKRSDKTPKERVPSPLETTSCITGAALPRK